MDEIKAQYETNVFGLIRTTQAVLPIMRRQKSGIIVNISSGAGRFGFPGGSAYASTKFAVEGLSVVLLEQTLVMAWLLRRNPKIQILHTPI
jgi:NADP-dependent 3-hydroxy acid dehydrogenase YdfG